MFIFTAAHQSQVIIAAVASIELDALFQHRSNDDASIISICEIECRSRSTLRMLLAALHGSNPPALAAHGAAVLCCRRGARPGRPPPGFGGTRGHGSAGEGGCFLRPPAPFQTHGAGVGGCPLFQPLSNNKRRSRSRTCSRFAIPSGTIPDTRYQTRFFLLLLHPTQGPSCRPAGADSLANDRLGCFNLSIAGHGEAVRLHEVLRRAHARHPAVTSARPPACPPKHTNRIGNLACLGTFSGHEVSSCPAALRCAPVGEFTCSAALRRLCHRFPSSDWR